MSQSPQRLPDYLGHIFQAIERKQCYTDQMRETAFCQSEMAQDAVIGNLEIIGEASHNIARVDPDFVSANPDRNRRCCFDKSLTQERFIRNEPTTPAEFG
jgi:hypothetical protein